MGECDVEAESKACADTEPALEEMVVDRLTAARNFLAEQKSTHHGQAVVGGSNKPGHSLTRLAWRRVRHR